MFRLHYIANVCCRHARDNKIHVWQIREDDEKNYSTTLPIDSAESTEHKQPWLLHTVPVNALNFCSFSMIHAPNQGTHDIPTDGILLGTPGLQDGSVNITSLPAEGRVATIPKPANIENAGMIMAIGLSFITKDSSSTKELLLLTGYESGHACVYKQPTTGASNKKWQCTYSVKSHAQPILSLDIAPKMGVFFTSGADAIIARHPLRSDSTLDTKTLQSKHAGQQGLTMRNDEKIFATAGWDGRMRVYSTKAMKELAVLKWHKEGCYAIAFAEVQDSENANDFESATSVTALSQTVAAKREHKARTTHWLAAGSKDGKVSLWDIY